MSLAALALLVIILATMCSSCEGVDASAAEPEPPRFKSEYICNIGGPRAYIITDTETGAQYLFVKSGYGGGLTVLQPGATEAEG